jgi:hypothetical protein
MKIAGSIIAALVLVLVILMLAKADDNLAAQQELKATIEAAQAKRFAALDKLRSEAIRINAEVDRMQAKVDAIQEEWKVTVAAALKTYYDKEREAQRQEYQGPIRGAQFLQVQWAGGSSYSSSSNPLAEINKAVQDCDKWIRENQPKYVEAVQKASAEGKPFEVRRLALQWNFDVAMKVLERDKKIYEIQNPRR